MPNDTEFDTQASLPPRAAWTAALAAAPAEAVMGLAAEIAASAVIEHLSPPQDGLLLLRLRDSVAGAPFHLGELPVSRAHVQLRRGEALAEGGAVVMSDDPERTLAIAVLDAALAAGWPEADHIARLVAEGEAIRAGTEAERALVFARTRVDFQTLSQADA